MKEMKFKKGCVYKASTTIWCANPDFIRSMEKALFTKSSVYPCHVDGTLYSYGTFRNELIPDDYYDSFELVGDTDDYKIAGYAYDCSDESLGMFNMLTITQYLIKKGII